MSDTDSRPLPRRRTAADGWSDLPAATFPRFLSHQAWQWSISGPHGFGRDPV